MIKRNEDLYLKDILSCISHIESFIKGMSFKDFSGDEKTASAVVWKLGVMGEAAKQLPKVFLAKHSNLPWKEMAKMRDKMIHSYFGIDYEIVWKVAREKLPALKRELRKIRR